MDVYGKKWRVFPVWVGKKRMSGLFETWMFQSYVMMRNEAVELINPHYEEWNAEYARLYPESLKDEDEEFKKYVRFIAKKQKPFLDAVNKKNMLMELYTGEDSGDIQCRLKLDKEYAMAINMKEIKD